jgi:hypothetical protein
MTDQATTLTQQIWAVKWAKEHALEMGRRAKERESVIALILRSLEAAEETLGTLEFARETLR